MLLTAMLQELLMQDHLCPGAEGQSQHPRSWVCSIGNRIAGSLLLPLTWRKHLPTLQTLLLACGQQQASGLSGGHRRPSPPCLPSTPRHSWGTWRRGKTHWSTNQKKGGARSSRSGSEVASRRRCGACFGHFLLFQSFREHRLQHKVL